MRMPPLPADSIHARACKLKCEKILTRPQEVSGSIPLISTKRLAFIRQVSFFAKKGGVRVYASLLVKLFSMYRVLEQGQVE